MQALPKRWLQIRSLFNVHPTQCTKETCKVRLMTCINTSAGNAREFIYIGRFHYKFVFPRYSKRNKIRLRVKKNIMLKKGNASDLLCASSVCVYVRVFLLCRLIQPQHTVSRCCWPRDEHLLHTEENNNNYTATSIS